MTVKLVIWSLDEVFWKGTLSKEKVTAIPRNLELVKAFVERGIMNSIVSKNNLNEAMAILQLWGIADYFVFPKGSLESKGKAIRKLLADCRICEGDTLFVDSKKANLEEVKFYNKGITCVFPSFFKKRNILKLDIFKGDEDKNYKKLRKYRILENKVNTMEADCNTEIVCIDDQDKTVNDNRTKVLMVGDYNLKIVCNALESIFEIDKEFNNSINNTGEIYNFDLCQLINAYELDKVEKEELYDNLPFYKIGTTFETKIFSNDYDIIVLSLADDYIRGIYKHKEKQLEIGYGTYWNQERELNSYSNDQLLYLKENFLYTGKKNAKKFKEDLEKILHYIGSDTRIILINRIEIDISDWIGKERCERNIEINSVVDTVVSRYDNVVLLDMRKIVRSKGLLTRRDDCHYDRYVYYRISQEIARLIWQFNGTDVPNKEIAISDQEKLFTKIKKRVKKICVVYGNCHTGGVIEVLRKNFDFMEEYYVYTIKFIQDMEAEKDLKDPVFMHCDLFIHQSIRLENRYGRDYASENIIKKLHPSCNIVAIPNVYGLPLCFFPQFAKGNEYKRRFPSEAACFFRDCLIEDELMVKGNIKSILRNYTDENYYSTVELQEKWNKFIEKVKSREMDWDIKLSEWIEKNRTKHLFFDPNHPTPVLIKHISFELLNFLGICVDEEKIMSLDIRPLDPYEIPVCKSVLEYFRMDYDVQNHKLRVNAYKLFPGHMNLKRYILQYYCMVWKEDKMPVSIKLKSFILYCVICGSGVVLNSINLLYRALKKRIVRCCQSLVRYQKVE